MTEPKVYMTITEDDVLAVGDLAELVKEGSIPPEAIVAYEGCGTHRIEIRDRTEFDDLPS